MCLVGNVAFANVFYIRGRLYELECVKAYAMHVLLVFATQRRQVKLINVPLKVLCPLFYDQCC